MKLTIEIDTDAVVAKMLEYGAMEYQYISEFWDAMFELHPDMMHTVYNEAMRLTRAVQAVEDAGRDDAWNRAWNEKFGGSKV